MPRTRVRNQRAIVDRKAVIARLEKLAGWSGYTPKTQPKVLAIFKDVLRQGQAEVRRRFEARDASGAATVAANAFLIDQIVRLAHDFAVTYVYPAANPTTGEQISVVAIGGYGRAELAPHSDIDLMFLLPYKKTPHTEQVVEFMLYLLWDLGLKVGHSTRAIDDCVKLARGDLTIRTSLLDARWLWGDDALFKEFRRRFQAEVVAGSGPQFVEAKLAERNGRHERMGDTRYVLEPNIKEGKGGLRDLQTLQWLVKYLYGTDDFRELAARGVLTDDDARRFVKARGFLWTVRCHLHWLADRPEERLTFNVQEALAERTGYADRVGARGVERFMKHYFLVAKDVGDLTRVLCAVLEDTHKKKRAKFRFPSLSLRRRTADGFRLDGDRVAVETPAVFQDDPRNLLRLFHEAQRLEADVHPRALHLVTQNLSLIDDGLRNDSEANRLFLDMLTSDKDPEQTLKRLSESGVLGRFIPAFGRVVAQMQYDMYHVYTVDEHTIRAIGVLHRIEQGRLADEFPVATEAMAEIQSRRTLYVALLCHDIAKGRGGDHSVLGAKVVEALGPRLGLSEWETATASWLVLHHLSMSFIAFKRDLEDPRTIHDVADLVQSPERLRMLMVLTAADIRAVGPTVWNAWKGGLLRELYYRTLEAVSGGLPVERRASRVKRAQGKVRAALTDWPAAEVERFLGLGYYGYWLTFDADTHVHHARLVRAAEARALHLHIETKIDAGRGVTDLTIYTPDHPGLFARIAGAVALGGANIVDAKAVTFANGMALDTFSIQDPQGGPFDEPARLDRVWKRIEDSLEGRIDPSRELARARASGIPSRTRVFTVAPRVLIDNRASAHHTVIEVNGRDRLGFLHDVTHALSRLGLQISSALISTYGERVVDVFYVKDVFGLKIDGEPKRKAIEAALLEAIGGGAEDGAT